MTRLGGHTYQTLFSIMQKAFIKAIAACSMLFLGFSLFGLSLGFFFVVMSWHQTSP
jgi:hypothetical protein